MPRNHVYISRRVPDDELALLVASGLPIAGNSHALNPPTREEILEGVHGALAAIVSLTEAVDDELLDAAGPSLKVVANVAVGTDNIDLAAATARGVIVTNTPGVLTDATADIALALMLSVSRRVVDADKFMRLGTEWSWGPDFFVGGGVSGATLGIIGCGRIGQAVAHRARAFGMRVIGAASSSPQASLAPGGIERVALADLLTESDFVSLHCPLTPRTRHLIGANQFAAMKPSAILINTARGSIVDEAALVEALRSGQIWGAGLDVFEDEPRVNPGLLDQHNVVLTPHIGSADTRTRRAMAHMAVSNVLAVIQRGTPLNPVV